jgi:hypothetical protein
MTTTATATKDKSYKLLMDKPPLSFILATRNTKRYPLMYFDEATQTNRALCYASNQKSPFEDEHDKNAIIPIIAFENGYLNVPRTNPALQLLLDLHPQKNQTFAEVDVEAEAKTDNDKFNLEVDALIAARGLSVDQQQNMMRVLFGKNPDSVGVDVMKREILRYAKSNPQDFLNQYNDPTMQYESQIRGYFDKKLLAFRNGQRDVYFNTTGNKSRMLVVPTGANPYTVVGEYLKEEGIEYLKMLDIEAENS